MIATAEEAAADARLSGAVHTVALEQGTVDLSPQIQIAMHAAATAAPANQAAATPAQPAPEAMASQSHADQEHQAVAPSGGTTVAASQPTAASDATASLVGSAPAMPDTAAKTSLAARAVQSLLSETALPSPAPAVADESAPDAVAVPVGVGLGDITIADLPELDTSVALFRETTLTGEVLTDTIIDFMARFGSYDVEFAEGRVLIEQHDAGSLSSDNIGIWTNLMEDGSAISVIGHIDLVTDVTISLS